MAAGAGLRPRPSPTTSISSSDSSANSAAGATFHFLAMRQRGMAAPASASARPHQRKTDERKRKSRKNGAPGERLAGDRTRSLAVVAGPRRRRGIYARVGGARAAASIDGVGSAPRSQSLPADNLERHLPKPTPHDQPVGNYPACRTHTYAISTRNRIGYAPTVLRMFFSRISKCYLLLLTLRIFINSVLKVNVYLI